MGMDVNEAGRNNKAFTINYKISRRPFQIIDSGYLIANDADILLIGWASRAIDDEPVLNDDIKLIPDAASGH